MWWAHTHTIHLLFFYKKKNFFLLLSQILQNWWNCFVQQTHMILVQWNNKQNFIRPIRIQNSYFFGNRRKKFFKTNFIRFGHENKTEIIKLRSFEEKKFSLLIDIFQFSFVCSAQLSPAVVTNTITKPTPPPTQPAGSISSGMPLPPPPSLSIHSSTPTSHSSFPPPLFATPLPPTSSSATVTTSAASAIPHPFSAESLFQTSKGMCSQFSIQYEIVFLFPFNARTKLIFHFLVWNQFRCCCYLSMCVCV